MCFPFDETFENFGWELNGTGSFQGKIFENLGQPFQCSRKLEVTTENKPVPFETEIPEN